MKFLMVHISIQRVSNRRIPILWSFLVPSLSTVSISEARGGGHPVQLETSTEWGRFYLCCSLSYSSLIRFYHKGSLDIFSFICEKWHPTATSIRGLYEGHQCERLLRLWQNCRLWRKGSFQKKKLCYPSHLSPCFRRAFMHHVCRNAQTNEDLLPKL